MCYWNQYLRWMQDLQIMIKNGVPLEEIFEGFKEKG
jgi:type II secretory pathway component PulF